MICGKYVKTFAEASHALSNGMHMNADYPFMLPPIKSLDGKTMTISGSGGQEATVTIVEKRGAEVAYIEQSSMFEKLFNPCLSGCVPRIPPVVPMQSIRFTPTTSKAIVTGMGGGRPDRRE